MNLLRYIKAHAECMYAVIYMAVKRRIRHVHSYDE
jgi:hypothetical protein